MGAFSKSNSVRRGVKIKSPKMKKRLIMMSLLKSRQTKQLENNYRPLLTNHVNTILASGLLLDEDYEVLLKTANFKMYLKQRPRLPFSLIACGVASLTSVIFARRYNQPLMVLAPVGLTLTKLYLEVKVILQENRRKAATSKAIESFLRLRKANRSIVQYFEIRSDVNSRQKESLILNNKNVEDFVKYFIENSTELLYYILNELNFLSSLTEELIDDFRGIKDLNVIAILQANNSLQAETVALKVLDLYALLTSKFLNYLGVSFCKLLNDFGAREMQCLLDDTLPRLTTRLNMFHQKVQKEFNNLRYCVNKKDQITRKKPLKDQISGKLQQTLVGSVNNLAVIIEKSQLVLQNVENLEETKNIREIETSLADLRDHAFATYESLDVLCRLYGILSQTSENTDKKSKKLETKANLDQNPLTPAVNFDDILEPLEENYELYLDKDYDTSKEDRSSVYEDQSTDYLGLMIKELSQSLKQHDRFIEAKNKRGIKEEDQTREKLSKNKENTNDPLPKFDLTALDEIKPKNKIDENFKPIPSVPAPPPLPLSVFKIEETYEDNSKTSLFCSIRALSNQMNRAEETFGSGENRSSSCESD